LCKNAGAVRRVAEYLGYRFLAFLVPLLPRPAVVWLGRRLGGLYMLLSPTARRVGLENLRRAFPERSDHRRILRRSLRQQGVAMLDALWSLRLTAERARRCLRIRPDQDALLRELLSRGRGIVLATGHFGSWEMLNAAGGAFGYPPATFIARPIRNRWIDEHFRRRREGTGNHLVYREKAMLACVAALRRGEIVCSVIDMAILPSQGGIFADFFGTPALTSAALPLLAVRRRTPLAFLACRPVDKGRYYEVEHEILEPRDDEDRDGEVRRLTRELNLALERAVRSCPEAWIWSYKRWKYRPSEQPGAYPSYARWLVVVPEAKLMPPRNR
jgi:KDO2-lipid IV(A) lauroyltransferase